MKISKLVLKPLDNNTYFIIDSNSVIIVDPANETNKIESFIKDNNLKLKCIFITHYHFDHIGSLEYLINKYKVKVYDYKTIGEYNIDRFNFKVIPTKGHSKDSVSFYFSKEEIMFVGDFIFYHSIGRMDLDGGSEEDMINSLNYLKTLNKNIILYPGHGRETTISHELLYNEYL